MIEAGHSLVIDMASAELELRIERKIGMFGLIIWIIIGGLIGWVASIIMQTNAQRGVFLNIVVGIVGAFIGGLVITGGSINAGINLTSVLVSLLGAVVLLGIVNPVRRGSVRRGLGRERTTLHG